MHGLLCTYPAAPRCLPYVRVAGGAGIEPCQQEGITRVELDNRMGVGLSF